MDILDVLFKLNLQTVTPYTNDVSGTLYNLDLNSYFVPIIRTQTPLSSLLDQCESSMASYKINWQLIEDLMDFVRMDLMNYCLSDNTHKSRVIDNYGLI